MDIFALAWWHWMVFGLALLVWEMLTPGGFYVLFFGLAAILVGALKVFGVSMGLALEGVVFVALAVAGLLLFRRPLLERFRRLTPQIEVDNLTSETASALEDIAGNAMGKVELRGTSWNAQNLGENSIPKATRCRVERVDGLTLYIRSI